MYIPKIHLHLQYFNKVGIYTILHQKITSENFWQDMFAERYDFFYANKGNFQLFKSLLAQESQDASTLETNLSSSEFSLVMVFSGRDARVSRRVKNRETCVQLWRPICHAWNT